MEKLFDLMDKAYEELYASYLDFKADMTEKNRKKLLDDIKDFNYEKNLFTNKIKDVYIPKNKKNIAKEN